MRPSILHCLTPSIPPFISLSTTSSIPPSISSSTVHYPLFSLYPFLFPSLHFLLHLSFHLSLPISFPLFLSWKNTSSQAIQGNFCYFLVSFTQLKMFIEINQKIFLKQPGFKETKSMLTILSGAMKNARHFKKHLT